MSLVRMVKLRATSGTTRPGPALGQALGPLGINMAEFCKQFNDRSEKIYKKDIPLSVNLHAMSDRSFTFDIKSPSTSYLIKQVIGMGKGPQQPNASANPVGYITPEMVYEIAKIKHGDANLKDLPLESVAKSIIGTCRSMGVICKEEEDKE